MANFFNTGLTGLAAQTSRMKIRFDIGSRRGLKGSSDTCTKRVLAADADAEAEAAPTSADGPFGPRRAEASFNSLRYSS